jgi:hypothetical protein
MYTRILLKYPHPSVIVRQDWGPEVQPRDTKELSSYLTENTEPSL